MRTVGRTPHLTRTTRRSEDVVTCPAVTGRASARTGSRLPAPPQPSASSSAPVTATSSTAAGCALPTHARRSPVPAAGRPWRARGGAVTMPRPRLRPGASRRQGGGAARDQFPEQRGGGRVEARAGCDRAVRASRAAAGSPASSSSAARAAAAPVTAARTVSGKLVSSHQQYNPASGWPLSRPRAVRSGPRSPHPGCGRPPAPDRAGLRTSRSPEPPPQSSAHPPFPGRPPTDPPGSNQTQGNARSTQPPTSSRSARPIGHLRACAGQIRASSVHAHRSLAGIPVRYVSVDPATPCPTALQGDTRRDREKRPASARIRS
jgi:hypothetical protein